MTLQDILEAVCKHKQVKRPTLYEYMRVCRIKPIGARQRPQNFPEDSAERIIKHLNGSTRIVSLKTLRDVRRRSITNGRKHATR